MVRIHVPELDGSPTAGRRCFLLHRRRFPSELGANMCSVTEKDMREEVVQRLLARGIAKTEIARRLRVSRKTVSRIGARVGFPAKARGPRRYDWERVREHYDAGQAAAACMARFGIAPASWDAAIARGEIVPHPRSAVQLAEGHRRRQVAALLEEGLSMTEVARRLGISTPTVCYHARKLGVPARSKFARRFDWREISRTYESGVSMRECKRRFGFSSQSWAAAVNRGDVVPRSRLIPLEQLLVVGRRTSRGHLKKRLLAAGLKEECCEGCGLTHWRGRPLSLQLHHRNGNGKDNRLENLELLCANCHSQTENWGGRNAHRRATLRLVETDSELEQDASDADRDDEDVA